MKIALCHPSVLPRRGGCETYIASLSRRLVADGHEVHLYAWRWDADALPSGLVYHHVELAGGPRFLRPWWFSRALRALLAGADHDVSVGFDKTTGVDVYYPQGGIYEASIALSLGKHRSVFLRRFLQTLRWFEPAHLSFLLMERAQYRMNGSVVVAISDMVRRHLEEYHGLRGERVFRVPIAPPPERLREPDPQGRRARFRAQWNLGPDRVVGLFVGMNYRLKGLEPLLEALAELRQEPLDLIVAGQSNKGTFVRQAQRLGIEERVRFVGYCPDMRDAYFASDLLVHPTFYDPCSNVVLEALACGLPVVTSRHNGASELLHPTGSEGRCAEGFVIDDPHDHARLAWCLQQLVDRDRRAECAAIACKTAAAWTFEDHYQALLSIMRNAARSRHGRVAA